MASRRSKQKRRALKKQSKSSSDGPKRKIRKCRDCSWNITEQTTYVKFLETYWYLMGTTASRKANKIFKQMALAVKTRTSIQAKSHHQKMEARYNTIPGIIMQVSSLIRETLLGQSMKCQRIEENFIQIVQPQEEQNGLENQEIVEELENVRFQENQRLILASYCSFFDEFSENYGRIEDGVIIDQYQPLF